MLHLTIFLYRCVLRFYPADFRSEYGEMMLLVFEEACRDRNSWLRLWQITTRDLIQSIYHEHRTKNMIDKIDDYTINATLGDGSSALIYRVYDPERMAQVALKVFNEDVEELADIEREGTVHQQLEHPNIPRCYGYISSEDSKYIVMEYVNGKTLLQMLQERNKPFSPKQVIEWAAVACDVLSYLHSNNYIYRDMKPGNLMLTPDDQIYLIDYGITVADGSDARAIGTEGYAPPEQYKGKTAIQSDLYALGASIHHLLTNRDPRYHKAHTFHEALPSAYNPEVSPELESVIMKALAHEPSERYESAEAMKLALMRHS